MKRVSLMTFDPTPLCSCLNSPQSDLLVVASFKTRPSTPATTASLSHSVSQSQAVYIQFTTYLTDRLPWSRQLSEPLIYWPSIGGGTSAFSLQNVKRHFSTHTVPSIHEAERSTNTLGSGQRTRQRVHVLVLRDPDMGGRRGRLTSRLQSYKAVSAYKYTTSQQLRNTLYILCLFFHPNWKWTKANKIRVDI